ncbi:flagellar basal-body rod protein FlgF [Lichenicoccus sp.]|uniref:flagellar basal-body rod protein FlgF n=1 Tax=Lichenicoccus sp. TaxID=2781899 RepID=UPI003D09A434
MENPTYIALSRLDAQQRTMDVIANNIANANTVGYQAQRVLFSDFMVQQQGVNTPPGGEALAFTQDLATYRDHSAGALTHTGNPLDLALGGDGYFTVMTPNGPRLTRAGRFGLLTDGTIADASGNALLDTSGSPIQLPAGDSRIQVAADGTISGESGRIGKIGVVEVSDQNKMTPEGGKLYRNDAATRQAPRPQVVEGAVEESNVQPISELTQMMQTEREFQFVTQFVQSESDRQQNTIDKMTQPQS